MGRPSKLTPERQAKIVQALEAGSYECVAAQYAGVDVTTYCAWKRRGAEEGKGKYYQFLQAVTHALNKSELALATTIRTAGKDDWRAAAWLMERRYKDRWAKREEVTGKDGAPLTPPPDRIVIVAGKFPDVPDADSED